MTSVFALGSRQVRRSGYGAMQLAGPFAFGPPPDRAAFRLDFPRWREGHGERDRALIDELMAGGRTGDVAARHGLSPARVSQKRAEFHADWHRFQGGERPWAAAPTKLP